MGHLKRFSTTSTNPAEVIIPAISSAILNVFLSLRPHSIPYILLHASQVSLQPFARLSYRRSQRGSLHPAGCQRVRKKKKRKKYQFGNFFNKKKRKETENSPFRQSRIRPQTPIRRPILNTPFHLFNPTPRLQVRITLLIQSRPVRDTPKQASDMNKVEMGFGIDPLGHAVVDFKVAVVGLHARLHG